MAGAVLMVACLASPVACGDAPASDSGTDEGEPADPDPTLEALAACDESDFGGTPFMGPSFDPETGELAVALPSSYVVATTAGWARPEAEHQEALGSASEEVSGVVFESPGLLGARFGGSEACGSARTLTLWESQEALMNFVWGEVHGGAMSLTDTTTLGWETTRWVESSAEPPTWDQARAALDDVRPEP